MKQTSPPRPWPVAQWLQRWPEHRRVASSVLGPGHVPGLQFQSLVLGRVWEAPINASLSHQCLSLKSPPLPPLKKSVENILG